MLARLKGKRLIQILIVLVSIFIIALLVAWLVLPSQLKKYVEENDKGWINREVYIGEIALNPFTFNLKISNLIIKEPDSKKDFVSLDKLSVNFDIWALTKSKLIIEKVALDKLFTNIQQNGTQFNFSDLLQNKNTGEENTEPFAFEVYNVEVSNSTIHYTDAQLGSKIVLDSIAIKDKAFRATDSILDVNIAVHQPEGGWVKGDVSYNLKKGDYEIDANVAAWQLASFKQYVASAVRLSDFGGGVDADIKLIGNTITDYIKSSGEITVNDFKMIDPEKKPLISVGKFFVDISEINSQKNIYDFKDISATNTKVNFEYLPNGDNFSKCLVTTGEVKNEKNTASEYYISPFEMLSVYIYDMTKEYIFKSYTADNIALENFNLKFYDYTLEDPFHMDLEQMSIKAQDIKPENQFAEFYVKGKMNSTAKIKGKLSVSRQGVENMNVDMGVKGLFLNRFSPYSRMYTAHRLMEGITSFSNKSEIKDSYLKSTNTLHIESIKVSKKDKVKNGGSLPMRLAVALMKDSKGNIDLDIPVEGPINDPKYKFGKVIWQVVKNLFTKVVTSPMKSLSNVLKVDENDLKNIYFDNGQVGLSPVQKKSLNSLAQVLSKKEALKIELSHLYNKEYEFDAIALKSAKLAYLKQTDLGIDKTVPMGRQAFDLPSTDPDFIAYLEGNTINYDATISISENARRLIGDDALKQELEDVIVKQKELIKNYLINEKAIKEERFVIKDGANTEEALNQSRPKFEVKFQVEE